MENKTCALFLDRDGVINHDVAYAHLPEQISFVDGIFDLARAAAARSYLIIIITNQAGIGRGLYTEVQFHALMEWMGAEFKAQGALISDYFFCPHHPEHGLGEYNKACECRKPAPGMLIKAQETWKIDMKASIFVGDKVSDMEAGRAANVGTLIHLADASEPVVSGAVRISALAQAIDLF